MTEIDVTREHEQRSRPLVQNTRRKKLKIHRKKPPPKAFSRHPTAADF
jgi:hypothetical protein